MASVDKIEERRKPEDFIGHRNRKAGHVCVNIGTKKLCIPRGIHSFGSCKYVFKNHKDGRDCQAGKNVGNQRHTGGYTGIPPQCTGDDNRA